MTVAFSERSVPAALRACIRNDRRSCDGQRAQCVSREASRDMAVVLAHQRRSNGSRLTTANCISSSLTVERGGCLSRLLPIGRWQSQKRPAPQKLNSHTMTLGSSSSNAWPSSWSAAPTATSSATHGCAFAFGDGLRQAGAMMKMRSCPLRCPYAYHREAPMQHLALKAAGARNGRNLA